MKKYKYSCVSRLFDTVRCNFVRLNKNFPFLSHQVILCFHAQPHCALCIVHYALEKLFPLP